MVLSTSARTPEDPPAKSGLVAVRPSDDESTPANLRLLVDEHLDFVWRSLRRFGVLEADVDDATQRVFLIASEKLALIKRGSERSFLVGVAARIAGHSRRSYRRREAAERSYSSHPRPANPNPEELTQRLEDRALLDRVLDGLSEDLRAVFVLFELEELSIDDIASLLSLPRGTVASRLRRAREVFHDQAKLVGGVGSGRKGTP
ncbi:MAG TPA: sigma-70 family RNA polymerase sigma factor [Polyangiaceae bacterium]